jgi:hypothetical protein
MRGEKFSSLNDISSTEMSQKVRIINRTTLVMLCGNVISHCTNLFKDWRAFLFGCLYSVGLVLIFRYAFSFSFGMLFPLRGKSRACPVFRLFWQLTAGPVIYAFGMTGFYDKSLSWGCAVFAATLAAAALLYLGCAAYGLRKTKTVASIES